MTEKKTPESPAPAPGSWDEYSDLVRGTDAWWDQTSYTDAQTDMDDYVRRRRRAGIERAWYRRDARFCTSEYKRGRGAEPVTDYAQGRRLYLDDQPLDACQGETQRLGWTDAREGIRRSAEEVDDRWEDM